MKNFKPLQHNNKSICLKKLWGVIWKLLELEFY
jgi:hypothetical protein